MTEMKAGLILLLIAGVVITVALFNDYNHRMCLKNFTCWYNKHRNPKIKDYEIEFIKTNHRDTFQREARRRKIDQNSNAANTLAAGMAINLAMGRSIVSPVGIGVAFAAGF